MAKKALKILEYILLFGLGVVLVWIALRGIDWKVFVDNLHTVRWEYVAMSGLCCLFALILRAERWKDMLRPLDPTATFVKAWDANNLGNLSYLVLAGSGDFVRTAGVTNKEVTYDKVFGTVLMERAWDSLMVVVVTVLAIVFKQDAIIGFLKDSVLKPAAGRMSLKLWIILGVVIIALVVFCVLIYKLRDKSKFFGKIAEWIKGVFDGIKAFLVMDRKGRFAVYTLLIWFFYVAMCQCVFWAMPGLGHLTFADALFLSAIGNFATIIPVPGGMGAFHYIIALAMSQIYGYGWEVGILFATLTHESRTILLVVLGAISALAMGIRRGKRRNPADPTVGVK